MTLYEKYGDNEYVATAVKDIEASRNTAYNLGVITSVAAFGLNEVARLTLRSRKFLPTTTRLSNQISHAYSNLQAQGVERCVLGHRSKPLLQLCLQLGSGLENFQHLAHPREPCQVR